MNRYLLTVPVMSSNVTDKTREATLRQLVRSRADRVLLALDRTLVDDESRCQLLEGLRENLAFFESKGFETGAWLPTLGFGAPLSSTAKVATAGMAKITDLSGATCEDAFCPLDPSFTALISELLIQIARIGPKMILLDDELCLSVRPGVGCACDRHLEALGRRLGKDLTRPFLEEHVFAGGENPYRTAWLELMGDTLKAFVKTLRDAVDSVNPSIRLGFCAGYTSWDLEGADVLEITKILAGGNRPFFRFTGAPYWTAKGRFKGQNLQSIIECVRMQNAWCSDLNIERFHEADSYPRPRFSVPSAYIEGFDLALRASGGMDGMKYLLDYWSSPDYETGYVDRHVRNLPLAEKLTQVFSDKRAVGVRVYEAMRKVKTTAFPAPFAGKQRVLGSFFSQAECILTNHAIPTTYEGSSPVGIVFGENARYLDEIPNGLIVDLPAALILQERGIDVGIISAEKTKNPEVEIFLETGERCFICPSDGSHYRVQAAEGAQSLSVFQIEDAQDVAAFLYENKDGQRFLVYTFDSYSVPQDSGVFRSYSRGSQIVDSHKWLCGQPLPASCCGHPGLYMICKQDHEHFYIALFNFCIDDAISPEIRLGDRYASIEFIEGGGKLEGNVLIANDIAPYGLVAAVLKK